MPSMLSSTERQLLDAICSYQDTHPYSPSYRELSEMVGLSSLATISKHMHRLKEKGYIDWDPKFRRAITVLRLPTP